MEVNKKVHELFALDNSTEEELQASCTRVGQHLYVKSNVKLNQEAITARAIEEFLVVFIMGGEGIRLQHITKGSSSKHMIDINGQPLSKYSFDLWRKRGLSNFRFLIDDSPAGQSISDCYGNGDKFGAKIKYSIEHSKIGTGGSLKEAILQGVIDNSFVSHYPDDQIVGYSDFPLDFVRVSIAAMEKGYQIIVVCVPGTVYPWGEVRERDGEVIDFVEKPFIRIDSYTGICAISSSLFNPIKQIDTSQGVVKIERTLFKEIARNHKMFKVLIPSEYWLPVNDWPALKRFEGIIQR